MASWDKGRSKFPRAADVSTPAAEEHLLSDQPTSRVHILGDAGHGDHYDARPAHSDGVRQDHPGVGRAAPRTNGFRYERDDEDFDDLDPPESSRSGFLRATVFCLSMALIGVGAAVIWHYYAPDIVLPASTRDVEKLNDSIGQLVQEQRKLTQTINAQQLLQDALQKTIVAREQDIQRLTAEVRAVRTDMDAPRSTAAAAPAQHPPLAQVPKRASSPPAAKKASSPPAAKRAERTTVRAEAEREPTVPSPQPQ